MVCSGNVKLCDNKYCLSSAAPWVLKVEQIRARGCAVVGVFSVRDGWLCVQMTVVSQGPNRGHFSTLYEISAQSTANIYDVESEISKRRLGCTLERMLFQTHLHIGFFLCSVANLILCTNTRCLDVSPRGQPCVASEPLEWKIL
jgi:hypothetical protein